MNGQLDLFSIIESPVNIYHIRRKIAGKTKQLLYLPLDTIDLIKGNRPPQEKIFVGDGSWHAVGSEFLRYFTSLALLRTDEKVLDVGCGIGRMAIPLTRYLRPPGGYTGFDIVSGGISWCRNNISTRYPHFAFAHADVFNKHYNPEGKLKASEYRFPSEDGTQDFVFLTSVFTHMLPPDVNHYLDEIARVLKPGGRCMCTFFLINSESLAGITSARSEFTFASQPGGYYVLHATDPEAAVAFEESVIRRLFEERQLTIRVPVRYGSWSGRRHHLSFQDIIIAEKKKP